MESFWSFRPRSRQAHNSAYESHLFLETLLETLLRLQLHRQWRQAFIWFFFKQHNIQNEPVICYIKSANTAVEIREAFFPQFSFLIGGFWAAVQ